MQALSSSSTRFYKFLMPVLFPMLVAIVGGVKTIEDKYNAPIAIFLFLAIALLEYWLYARIKKISLDRTTLVISNFFREERVSIANLDYASGSLGVRPEVVWLYFKIETRFGKTVSFVPKDRAFPGFNKHPTVEMLNSLARNAKHQADLSGNANLNGR